MFVIQLIVRASVFATAVLVAGCAADPTNNTLVVLQHPETKDTKQCTADAWTTWNVYAATEACAKAYEKAGYVRLGAY